MASRRYAILFAVIFLFGMLPLFSGQGSGLSSAGWTSGFLNPFDHPLHIALFVLIGLGGVALGRDAAVLLPLSFLLMLWVGLLFELGSGAFAFSRLGFFVAVILYSFLIGLVVSRSLLMITGISAAIAFYLGASYAHTIGAMVPPLYFTLGNMVGAALMLATGVSFGLVLVWDLRRALLKIRQQPKVEKLLSLLRL